MRVTLIQSDLHWENAEANRLMFDTKILSVPPTDLIVLPEMFASGFTMNAAMNAETMDGPIIKWMQNVAKEKNCAITGSLIVKENGKFYNRLIWTDETGTIYTYDKRHLFSLAEEQKTYTAGNQQLIIQYRGWRICPLICYDLRFPVWSRRNKNLDYDLLLYVANWPERRNHAWKQLLIARAIENQSYVIGVNRVGNDGNSIFHSGDSVLLDYRGICMSDFYPGQEKIETHALDAKDLQLFRTQFAFGNDTDDFTINKDAIK